MSCLISPARLSSVSRSPYSPISCAAVFTPMPGTPGTLSLESPISDCTSITFSGGTPNFSITSSRPIRLSFMVSYMTTVGPTSCIRSLSEETMVRCRLRFAGEPRIGRDQVVGLVAGLFEAGNIEGVHGVADQRKLRNEIVRRRVAVGLVFGIHFRAEGLFGLVEHDGQMCRPLFRLHVAQQLPQHVAEAEHGIDLQAVGLAGERRQRVIGAEDVARSVHQKDVVAFLERRAAAAAADGMAFFAGLTADFAADLAGMAANVGRARRALSMSSSTFLWTDG